MGIYGCPVGAKFQITLPKEVRTILGIHHKGEMVGFSIEGSKIALLKARIEPEETFTEEEWRKIIQLANQPAAKSFKSAAAFVKDMKRLSGRLKKSRR